MPNIWATFVRKYVFQEVSTVAQSGHTEFSLNVAAVVLLQLVSYFEDWIRASQNLWTQLILAIRVLVVSVANRLYFCLVAAVVVRTRKETEFFTKALLEGGAKSGCPNPKYPNQL